MTAAVWKREEEQMMTALKTVAAALLLIAIFLPGCTPARVVRVSPDPNAKDVYSFTLYPRDYASEQRMNMKAVDVFREIMLDYGYDRYRILDVSRGDGFLYRVKFYRDERDDNNGRP